jgi:hypothetical protein
MVLGTHTGVRDPAQPAVVVIGHLDALRQRLRGTSDIVRAVAATRGTGRPRAAPGQLTMARPDAFRR